MPATLRSRLRCYVPLQETGHGYIARLTGLVLWSGSPVKGPGVPHHGRCHSPRILYLGRVPLPLSPGGGMG